MTKDLTKLKEYLEQIQEAMGHIDEAKACLESIDEDKFADELEGSTSEDLPITKLENVYDSLNYLQHDIEELIKDTES